MQRADEERTTALSTPRRSINHSFAAKQWKNGLAFISMRSRFFTKNRSSSPKALIVINPAMDSARWFGTKDFVVPLIHINSFAALK